MTAAAVKTKEHPILFSGPMVRAILEGRKTVTRRVVTEKQMAKAPGLDYMEAELLARSPYGKPGDILWVRETWRPRSWGKDFDWMCVEYRANENTQQANFKKDVNPMDMWDSELQLISAWEKLSNECRAAGCDWAGDTFILNGRDGQHPIKWRPSIFMPRAACRLKLRITDVRVEQLQEITSGQAMTEGVNQDTCPCKPLGNCASTVDWVAGFKHLWNEINEKAWLWLGREPIRVGY